MKSIVKFIALAYTTDDEPMLTLTLATSRQQAQEEVAKLTDILSKGKQLDVEIKQHRKKRSLDANSMAWVLMSKIAEAVNSSKDEVYLQMLERYGVFTHIVVKPHMVDKVRQEWRTVRELGEVTVNGKTGMQLQCFFGSSTYDTKEFSTLLDGVISECKNIGVEVLPEDEIKTMLEEWGR